MTHSEFIFAHSKYPRQDGDDELIATPSAASPPTGVNPEYPYAAADNSTTLFPPKDFDQTTGSGMLPPLSGEDESGPKIPARDPEEVQPTAESEPQNKTPDPRESEKTPESKKTLAGASADWVIR